MRIASLGIIFIILCAGCKSQELAPKQLLDLVNSAAGKIENRFYTLHNNYYRYTIYPFFKYINDGLQYYNTDSMIGRVVVTGEEIFRGEKCYKVETLTRKGKNKMKSRQYYYISAKTFLPVRNYVTFEDSTGKAREVQVFDVWIDEIKFDIPSSDGFLKSSLGNYNREVSLA